MNVPSRAAGPSAEVEAHAAERATMVRDQIVARDVTAPAVLGAMRRVPRHRFVPSDQRSRAHEDFALPLGDGQTISQPYIVAFMSAAAEIKPGDKVLEVGTGCGYQAAVLAELGARVFTIERLPSLGLRAAALLRDLGYTSIKARIGDGSLGWPEEAPFDAIVVTAAADEVPAALREQLVDGGRLVVPVGRDPLPQNLMAITRVGHRYREKNLLPVRFVPLIAG